MSIDSRTLATSLAGFRSDVTAPTDLVATLDRLVRVVKDIFGVHGAGLLLVDSDQALRYVAASDPAGRVLEVAQEQAGDGPCIRAFVEDRVVPTTDCIQDERWPQLWPLLEGHGVRAVLGLPIRLGGGPVGTLDVYRRDAYEWSRSEQEALRAYAEVTEHLIAAALEAHHAGELAAQLQYALDYRVVIERAIGYLMASRRLDAVAAFELLRRTARSSRRKVAELAEQILRGEPLSTEVGAGGGST